MPRIEFLAVSRRGLLAGAAALAAIRVSTPPQAFAQVGKLRRIGMLLPFAQDDGETPYRILAFEEGLGAFGWVNGETVEILYRSAPQRERQLGLARELVAAECEVIVAAANTALDALLSATQTVPIIFVHVGDPVATGRLKDPARPGGNFSGFVNFEYSMLQKQVQLLMAVAPRTRRIAVLFNPETFGRGVAPTLAAARASADMLGLGLIEAPVHEAGELETVFAALAQEPHLGLFVVPDVFAAVNRKVIVELAAQRRIPAMYFGACFVETGGLISYGVESRDLYRRCAAYVDKCLRGAVVGDLPVQFPVSFELAVNLKAAENLGLTMPAAILAQAERVFD